ncbi:GGDEF domain-containing protein [Tindallia californiensis]|uniref:Diguanylate cyclase (GGDEF) domain-containing protein n=1 Tax=Tindallia californiensis TaxID=159292 RepID=A0A1H3IG23_9FIRM|nr:GGDEF domain-containing protein [Tindallia californiensis]SDY26028.1 diguanylate cyclase (GGDEF) domain-containing protein [Tindallia californiensis]
MIKMIEGFMTDKEFYHHLQNEILTFSKEIVLVKLNIDDFETVNRFYGEYVGDQVIRNTAKMLVENLREDDLVCRTHKDEFLVMMPDTSRETGNILIEEIRNFRSEHTMMVGEKSLKIRFSAGIASFPHNGKTKEVLIEAVDKALVKAKTLGKNRICLAVRDDWVEKHVCITKEMALKLREIASKRNKTESGLIRAWLEEMLENHDV